MSYFIMVCINQKGEIYRAGLRGLRQAVRFVRNCDGINRKVIH